MLSPYSRPILLSYGGLYEGCVRVVWESKVRVHSLLRAAQAANLRSTWRMDARVAAARGVVTATSLGGVGETRCNLAGGAGLVDCTQPMLRTATVRRARSHCRCVPPLSHFIPYSLV